MTTTRRQTAMLKPGKMTNGIRQRWSSSRRRRKRPVTLAPVPSLNTADPDESVPARSTSAKDDVEG
jgi:hypothetical protein